MISSPRMALLRSPASQYKIFFWDGGRLYTQEKDFAFRSKDKGGILALVNLRSHGSGLSLIILVVL